MALRDADFGLQKSAPNLMHCPFFASPRTCHPSRPRLSSPPIKPSPARYRPQGAKTVQIPSFPVRIVEIRCALGRLPERNGRFMARYAAWLWSVLDQESDLDSVGPLIGRRAESVCVRNRDSQMLIVRRHAEGRHIDRLPPTDGLKVRVPCLVVHRRVLGRKQVPSRQVRFEPKPAIIEDPVDLRHKSADRISRDGANSHLL
jgi:hypothetical protein